MLILPNHEKAVVFLCVDRQIEDNVRRVPVSTGFLVNFPENSIQWTYVITARHAIEDAESDAIYIRLNMKGPGVIELRTQREDWYTHPEADVAAVLFSPTESQTKELDLGYVHANEFIHHGRYWGSKLPQNMITSMGGFPVELGDDVYFIGLFYRQEGRTRNLPIARFGGISRMFQEPITFPRDRGTNRFSALVYLVECRSWGGHSGSPTFWVSPVTLHKKIKGERFPLPPGCVQGLLGLVSWFAQPGSHGREAGERGSRI